MLLTLLLVPFAAADSPFSYFKDWTPIEGNAPAKVSIATSPVSVIASGSIASTSTTKVPTSTINNANNGDHHVNREDLLTPDFVWPGKSFQKVTTGAHDPKTRAVNEHGKDDALGPVLIGARAVNQQHESGLPNHHGPVPLSNSKQYLPGDPRFKNHLYPGYVHEAGSDLNNLQARDQLLLALRSYSIRHGVSSTTTSSKSIMTVTFIRHHTYSFGPRHHAGERTDPRHHSKSHTKTHTHTHTHTSTLTHHSGSVTRTAAAAHISALLQARNVEPQLHSPHAHDAPVAENHGHPGGHWSESEVNQERTPSIAEVRDAYAKLQARSQWADKDLKSKPKSSHAELVDRLLKLASHSAHARRAAAVGEAVVSKSDAAEIKETVGIPQAGAKVLLRSEQNKQDEAQSSHAELVKPLLKMASHSAHANRAAAVRGVLTSKSSFTENEDAVEVPHTDAKLLPRNEHDAPTDEKWRHGE